MLPVIVLLRMLPEVLSMYGKMRPLCRSFSKFLSTFVFTGEMPTGIRVTGRSMCQTKSRANSIPEISVRLKCWRGEASDDPAQVVPLAAPHSYIVRHGCQNLRVQVSRHSSCPYIRLDVPFCP